MTGPVESSVRQVDRYLLYPSFAAGGMATIHLGRQTGALGVGRVVAIKRLQESLARDEHFRAMFLDEARIASGIEHPNVVRTLDVISTESELMIVMELVRGDAFSRLLAACRDAETPVPLAIASAIVGGALDGLHAAHEAVDAMGRPLEIVHRDVSPHNILVGDDGIPRIADFGIAHALGRSSVTRTGEIKGKLSYMPPEQMRSEQVDRRADVYAVAVILWETLTGRRLYTGPDPSVLFSVLEEEPPAPSTFRADLPAGMDALVMRGLAKDPGERFASALEMARALEQLVPPARPRDVGAWVREWAGEAIERQASMVGRVEAGGVSAGGDTRTDRTITGTNSGVSTLARSSRAPSLVWGIAGVGVFTATLALGALAYRANLSGGADVTPTIPLPAGPSSANAATERFAEGPISEIASATSSSAPPTASASSPTATPPSAPQRNPTARPDTPRTSSPTATNGVPAYPYEF